MVTAGEEILVGDGLLFGDNDREIRAVGALSSFFIPWMAFLDGILSEGDDAAMTMDVVGGKVFNLIGTNALRISSAADSLPDSLGLFGGVLDGLFGMVADTAVLLVVFGGSVAYSVG